MKMRITRRAVLASALAASSIASAKALSAADVEASKQIAALELKNGGRLGVALYDASAKSGLARHGGERFAMCSTFKCLVAALILKRVDKGEEDLARRITYSAADVLPNSPATKEHVADGMTVGALCEAIVTQSDNTAANLLLPSFGGPAGFTSFVRSLGDKVTRLDRVELALNDWKPGEVRDTTSPWAMLDDLKAVAIGDALSPGSREQLVAWLVANKTGDKRLRAGIPKGWKVGDKTGTSGSGIYNDIAVVWPPQDRGPLVIAAYYSEAGLDSDKANAVIAEVGAIASRWIMR
jgi:beta-lactamase class A